jgi:multicomponent Na+:H+ antiporter subunit E
VFRRPEGGHLGGVRRWLAVFTWAYLTWTVLSWTASVEAIVAGLDLSALTAVACTPLGSLAGPWQVFVPRRAVGLVRLGGHVLVRMIVANIELTRRIWTPRLPVPSGMVVVPTTARSDGEYAAVGVLTSIIVDSQLVDLDRNRQQLQYHVVDTQEREINAAVEARIERLTRP